MMTDLQGLGGLRIAILAAVVAGLSACGSASDISTRNADYFGASLKDGTISGSYNPAGYDGGLVQNQIRAVCVDEVLGGYSETPGDAGLVAFSATCANGTTFRRAFMEIERLPSGNFAVEITGS
ncbi:hypothetical protein [Yoonia sp. SS1-5]|uniref:Succinate dehydrogenase n=1 Tax=Yoonia rhodophyticola TaxID=3137370 RepID=A0AAN0MD21_9RHOB